MHITCQSDIYFICKEEHNMDFLHFLLSLRLAENGLDVVAVGGTVETDSI